MSDDLKQAVDAVLDLQDLNPSDETNRAFSNLVTIVQEFDGQSEIVHVHEKCLPELRNRCAVAEGLLELHWACLILNHSVSMEEFPYYQNYVDLCAWELNALKFFDFNPQLNRLVFMGGGPLPLTAIVMAKEYGIRSEVIDIDPQAVETATKLIEKLGLNDWIVVKHEAGDSYDKISSNDVIYVAALAGLNTEQKGKIMRNIFKQISTTQLVLLRGAHSSRQLLYPDISEADLEQFGFEQLLRIDPFVDIINSIIIARKI